MATVTKLEQLPFKPGQDVGAYAPSSLGPNRLFRRKPLGPPQDTETVASDGSLSYTNLPEGFWVAAAPVDDAAGENSKAVLVTGSGDGGIRWEAKTAGRDGNDLSVELVDPGSNDAPLSVSYGSGKITVSLATGSGGAVTSTAATVIAAVRANATVFALVEVKATGTGTGVQVAAAEASFEGGGAGWGNIHFYAEKPT
jgi:hypothetical protein